MNQSQNQSSTPTTVVNQTIVQQPAIRKYNCPYCLGRVEGKPSENGLQSMTCPNCGGVLTESDAISEPVQQQVVQTVQPQTYSQPAAQTYTRSAEPVYPRQSLGDKIKSCFGTIFAFVIIGAIVFGGFKFYEWYDNRHQNNQPGYHEEYDNRPEQHDPIYVPALGRDVSWDTEYECYYDRQTDCYFFRNTDMDPPVWQYWFEGISSDYGDYGWMEWDAKEVRWYVQTGANNWEPLPADKTSGLWHFD